MEVDRDVEARASEAAAERKVIGHPRHPPAPGRNDELVDMGVVEDDGRSRRFHNVGEMGDGEGASEGADDRSREDHVTDEPQTNEQDPQGSIVASSISMTGMSSLIG